MPKIAITRGISASMESCELVHLERVGLDLELLRKQHRTYEKRLIELGAELTTLPIRNDLADSVFVEDTAIVFEEFAIITRPGAASRRAETESVARALAPHRELIEIAAPGTMDGGDVLCVGETVFVGESTRTNAAAMAQLETVLTGRGYTLRTVPVVHCLHLKSAVTWIGEDRLLANPDWVDLSHFGEFEIIDVAPSEPFAANAVPLGNAVVHGTAYPETRARMERFGIRVAAVDISEIAKAEGAVSCCSLIFDA